MASKQMALNFLKRCGFELDEDTFFAGRTGYQGTIDPVGKMSILGDCRGIACAAHDAPSFWAQVIEEAAKNAPFLEPCPDPEHCEMHGPDSDGEAN